MIKSREAGQQLQYCRQKDASAQLYGNQISSVLIWSNVVFNFHKIKQHFSFRPLNKKSLQKNIEKTHSKQLKVPKAREYQQNYSNDDLDNSQTGKYVFVVGLLLLVLANWIVSDHRECVVTLFKEAELIGDLNNSIQLLVAVC